VDSLESLCGKRIAAGTLDVRSQRDKPGWKSFPSGTALNIFTQTNKHTVGPADVRQFLTNTINASFPTTKALSEEVQERFIALCVRVLASPLNAFDNAVQQHNIATALRSLTVLALIELATAVTAMVLDNEPSVNPAQLSSLIATAVKKELATMRSTQRRPGKQNTTAKNEKRACPRQPFGRSRTSTGRPRSRRSRQIAYAKTRTHLWSRPIQIETRLLEKQLEDASYLTLEKLRLTYGFIADYSLTPNRNAAHQLSLMPPWLHFSQPTNIAYHNICTSISVPPTVRSLLGLGLNFCIRPCYCSGPDYPDFTRFYRDALAATSREDRPWIPSESKPLHPSS
jgi:hypothetical protein